MLICRRCGCSYDIVLLVQREDASPFLGLGVREPELLELGGWSHYLLRHAQGLTTVQQAWLEHTGSESSRSLPLRLLLHPQSPLE